MKITILIGKVLETKTVFKKDLIDLTKKEIEAEQSGDYFLLLKPLNGIDRIKKDFAIAA